jgi:hypothetical protein
MAFNSRSVHVLPRHLAASRGRCLVAKDVDANFGHRNFSRVSGGILRLQVICRYRLDLGLPDLLPQRPQVPCTQAAHDFVACLAWQLPMGLGQFGQLFQIS